MRVTFVSRQAAPAIGGISTYLRLVAAGLARDHEVEVLAQFAEGSTTQSHFRVLLPGEHFCPFDADGVRTAPLALRPSRRVRAVGLMVRGALHRIGVSLPHDGYLRYARLVGEAIAERASAPDVLHIFQGGNMARAGAEAARRLRVPMVVTPFAHPGQWDDDPASGIAYRQAARVVASGEADADTYLKLGVPRERLSIVEPCTAPLPVGGGADLRRRYGIDGPLVLFIGRRSAYKGDEILLEAAESVIERVGAATWAFVGPGELPAVPSGLRVVDAGLVDEREKAAWLEAADVVSLPSEFESFGLVVAEAWSLGTPVVTSRSPALAELVGTAGGGMAVERDPSQLADALSSLLSDDQLRGRLGAQGHDYWKERLTPERNARAHVEVYKAVLEEKASEDPTGTRR